LWKLGLTLKALGIEIPAGDFVLDLDDLVGRECIGIVRDDKFEGEMRSKLSEVMSADETAADRAKTRRDSKIDERARGRLIGRPHPGPADIDLQEVEAMAEDELADLIEKRKLNVDLRSHKTLRRKQGAVISALEENDLLA
jgi:hypothetical protein